MYGDMEVPVFERDWMTTAERLPYWKTYGLKPGELWKDTPITHDQWEYYVLLEDGPVPVGAVIARELMAQGATSAVFTEMWSRLVLVGPDLVCVNEEGDIREVLDELRAATGGNLAGLPDVIACFPHGRIVMREAKHIAAKYKDRLGPKQHAFARAAQRLFGSRLDLAIVEWGRLPSGQKA
ncbi:MAG TPA: hypothetical protein DCG89_06100 [Spartobacteria bacterium]|nr:hypothetical protein [Spartobacteria bacterium]HAF13840.1 hypothetical protein [Blastocatellia bacterium]